MNYNMKQWLQDQIHTGAKKPLPLLSFPCVQMMGITVRELISDSSLQAKGMELVAGRVNSAASVSLMDLSVEAEAFGATVRVSDDEVPTIIGAIITDEDEADALQIPAVGTARTGIYLEAIEKATKVITDRPVFAGVIGLNGQLSGHLGNVGHAQSLGIDHVTEQTGRQISTGGVFGQIVTGVGVDAADIFNVCKTHDLGLCSRGGSGIGAGSGGGCGVTLRALRLLCLGICHLGCTGRKCKYHGCSKQQCH